jgi:polyphenol oxidase
MISLEIDRICAPGLAELPHGFLGRGGGVSAGIYAGLNSGLGSDDDPVAVVENRRRAVKGVLPGAQLVTLHQVHSAIALPVVAPFPDGARPHADAMVTATPGLLLGILTADCAPVLFADQAAGVVGAAHAGWKGALGGVTDATIAAMEVLGARRDRIVAAVGPCIVRASYEVSEAFAEPFVQSDAANAHFFADGRAGHLHFDLEAYVAARLAAAGLARVDTLGLDTRKHPDRFFSYRRTTLAGEPDYGRQISLIGVG